MSCTATLVRRGFVHPCARWHREGEPGITHGCDEHYWGGEGETTWTQCPAEAVYCGEQLRCDCDIRDPARGCDEHWARSARYGDLMWSHLRRPQPAVMFHGMSMGHRFGSHEADAMMVAAATMQDAANRLEYAHGGTR